MAGVFPDSGVPASDAKNSIVDPDTLNCPSELWYSTSRCQPRFDPAAANAVTAEIVNLVNCAGLPYDCTKLDNLCAAVKNLICDVITGCLEPCDFDLLAKSGVTVHQLMVQEGGSNCRKIVKAVVQTGSMDLWVRTDGNDTIGDGSANTPDKAFRTIAGAWASVASRKTVTSPIYPLNIRLGIPGTYEAANIQNYGGPVFIWGDVSNRRNYRIDQSNAAPSFCIHASNVSLQVYGVTLVADTSYASLALVMVEGAATAILHDMEYEVRTNITNGSVWLAMTGGTITLAEEHLVRGIGATRTVAAAWRCTTGGVYWGGPASGGEINIETLDFAQGCVHAIELAVVRWASLTVTNTSCTGPEYLVTTNSIFSANGQTVPGDEPGVINTGGQFLA